MTQTTNLAYSPLSDINCSFAEYVARRKAKLSAHMDGHGLPDYAYVQDYEYRKKIDAIPGLYKNARRLLAPRMQQEYQHYNLNGVAAGPTQFNQIYEMGVDCARVLGIGIPKILIIPGIPDPSTGTLDEFNACAYAFEDQEPLILVTSLMAQRMTPGELKCIIGHECGHIHNGHVVYMYLATLLLSIGLNGVLSLPGLRQLAGLLSSSTTLLMSMWQRAAEVSADRAAMLCCESLEDAYGATKKMMYSGAHLENQVDVSMDLDSLRKQLEMAESTPNRFLELYRSHPIPLRRLFAQMEFAKCETLYSWRPDLKKPGLQMRSREGVDKTCESIIGIVKKTGGKKHG